MLLWERSNSDKRSVFPSFPQPYIVSPQFLHENTTRFSCLQRQCFLEYVPESTSRQKKIVERRGGLVVVCCFCAYMSAPMTTVHISLKSEMPMFLYFYFTFLGMRRLHPRGGQCACGCLVDKCPLLLRSVGTNTSYSVFFSPFLLSPPASPRLVTSILC